GAFFIALGRRGAGPADEPAQPLELLAPLEGTHLGISSRPASGPGHRPAEDVGAAGQEVRPPPEARHPAGKDVQRMRAPAVRAFAPALAGPEPPVVCAGRPQVDRVAA